MKTSLVKKLEELTEVLDKEAKQYLILVDDDCSCFNASRFKGLAGFQMLLSRAFNNDEIQDDHKECVIKGMFAYIIATQSIDWIEERIKQLKEDTEFQKRSKQFNNKKKLIEELKSLDIRDENVIDKLFEISKKILKGE